MKHKNPEHKGVQVVQGVLIAIPLSLLLWALIIAPFFI